MGLGVVVRSTHMELYPSGLSRGNFGGRAFGEGEGVAQLVALAGVAQVFKFEFLGLVNGVGEIGVDMDLVHVRHNQ